MNKKGQKYNNEIAKGLRDAADAIERTGNQHVNKEAQNNPQKPFRATFGVSEKVQLMVKLQAPIYGISMGRLVEDAILIHLGRMEQIKSSEYHKLSQEVPAKLSIEKLFE